MRIKFNTRTAKIIDREIVTAGSVGMKVAVELSPDWAGLTKTAVFSGSGESIIVLESSWSGNEVEIPHECCTKAGTQLLMGIWGTNAAGTVVIPTVMVQLDFIKAGADPSGDESTDPTLPVWAQLQAGKQNKLTAGDNITIDANGRISAAVTAAVASVNGHVGAVTLAAADVGALPTGYHDSAKQDVVSDLATIRAGAAAGATALQAVPNTYRTAAAQDALHDASKADATALAAVKDDVDDIKRVIDALYEEAVDG